MNFRASICSEICFRYFATIKISEDFCYWFVLVEWDQMQIPYKIRNLSRYEINIVYIQ